MSDISGIILIDKPEDIVSFKITKRINRLLGVKAGHAGTLDPFASGLMIIAYGKATRLLEFLSDADKEYDFTVKWNIETDSLDRDGDIINKSENKINWDNIDSAIENLHGQISQIPPKFSAIKQNGVPLYKLAREGKDVDLKPRETFIYSLTHNNDNKNLNESSFSCKCSKGTYIRSLARDIAYKLNNLCFVNKLRRTKIDKYDVNNALKITDLDELNKDIILKNTIKTENIDLNLPKFELDQASFEEIKNGRKIIRKDLPFRENDIIRLIFNKKLIGIGIYKDHLIAPKKVLTN